MRSGIIDVNELIRRVIPVDETWRERARERLDTLTKPLGSLGRLEDLAAQLAAIRQRHISLPISKAIYVFAADHGVVAEGVSAYPREVTYQMVLNFLAGGAAVNVLARLHGATLRVIDVGVDADFDEVPGLLHHKVARGTRNVSHEPAMTQEQVVRAIAIGSLMADEAFNTGQDLVIAGEMGIGNTTSASAITCVLTGASAALVTGRGTGLNEEGHARKIAVVERILLKHFEGSGRTETAPEPLEILQRVGGLEIAAMTGLFLAAAGQHLAIIADGFISTAAAAIAVALAPNVRDYVIAGHCSEEPGHQMLLDYLGLKPLLALGMRLGEGSGALLAIPIVEAAICLYSQMATFRSASISEASA